MIATIDGQRDDNPAATAILGWIAKGRRRSFRESQVRDNFRRGWADKPQALTEALAWLADRNVIRKAPNDLGRRGHQPGPSYEVNPALFTDGGGRGQIHKTAQPTTNIKVASITRARSEPVARGQIPRLSVQLKEGKKVMENNLPKVARGQIPGADWVCFSGPRDLTARSFCGRSS